MKQNIIGRLQPREHDRLEELRKATAKFAASDPGQPFLEYLASEENTSISFTEHVFHLWEILKTYRDGVFDDQNPGEGDQLFGSAYYFVRLEEGAAVVKSSLEELRGKPFAEGESMREDEESIRKNIQSVAVFCHDIRKLEDITSDFLKSIEKGLPDDRERSGKLTQRLLKENVLVITSLLCVQLRPDDEVVRRVASFARLIHKYAVDELKNPPREISPPLNGLLVPPHLRGRF